MVTTVKSDTSAIAKPPKIKRTPPPLTKRIADQLTKAVLGGKISKDELAKLVAHVAKLEAFVEA